MQHKFLAAMRGRLSELDLIFGTGGCLIPRARLPTDEEMQGTTDGKGCGGLAIER